MTISVRLNDRDSEIIKKYAQINGISVSELIRQSVMERIEDKYDLRASEAALADFKADPGAYTLEEIEKELGF